MDNNQEVIKELQLIISALESSNNLLEFRLNMAIKQINEMRSKLEEKELRIKELEEKQEAQVTKPENKNNKGEK